MCPVALGKTSGRNCRRITVIRFPECQLLSRQVSRVTYRLKEFIPIPDDSHIKEREINPFVDVKKVLALARASAMPKIQKKYDEATVGPRIDPAVTEKKKKPEPAKKEPAEDTTAKTE